MRITVECFCGGGSGRYGSKIDTSISGGFGIDIAVASVEYVFRSCFEPLHGFPDPFWIWLKSADIIAADDPVDELWYMVEIKFFLDAVTGLAGDDSNPGTALAQRS